MACLCVFEAKSNVQICNDMRTQKFVKNTHINESRPAKYANGRPIFKSKEVPRKMMLRMLLHWIYYNVVEGTRSGGLLAAVLTADSGMLPFLSLVARETGLHIVAAYNMQMVVSFSAARKFLGRRCCKYSCNKVYVYAIYDDVFTADSGIIPFLSLIAQDTGVHIIAATFSSSSYEELPFS